MTVRRLAPHEWALLRRLRLAGLRESPNVFGSTVARELAQDEARWRERLAASVWFVAEVAGEPAGLVRGAGGPGGRRHLHSMWVHPAHRGARVGSALIAAVRAWAVADGADELVLWVVEDNAVASRLYAREGFAPTGLREPVAARTGVGQEQWVLRLTPADADALTAGSDR